MSQVKNEMNNGLAIEILIQKMLKAGRILKDSFTYEESVKSLEDTEKYRVKGTTLSKWLIVLEKNEDNLSFLILNFWGSLRKCMNIMLDEANDAFKEATNEERDKYYKLLDRIFNVKKLYNENQIKIEDCTEELAVCESPENRAAKDTEINLYKYLLKVIHEEISSLEKEFAEKYHKPTQMPSASTSLNEFLNAMQNLLLEPLGSSSYNMRFNSKPEAMKQFLAKNTHIFSFLQEFIEQLIKFNNYYVDYLKTQEQISEIEQYDDNIEQLEEEVELVDSSKRYTPLSDDLLDLEPSRKKQKIEDYSNQADSSFIVKYAQIFNDPFANPNDISILRNKLGIENHVKVLTVLPNGKIQLMKGNNELVWDHVDSMFHSFVSVPSVPLATLNSALNKTGKSLRV